MSRAQSGSEAGAALSALHDAALLTALFWTPIFWGQVVIAETHYPGQFTSSSGQALITGLVGLAAIGGLLGQWVSGSRKWRLANAIHLPAVLLLVWAAVSALFSVSHHASTIELARLATGVAIFFLVANRPLLPASRPVVVASALVCSALLTFFIPTGGDPGLRLKAFSVIGLGIAAALIVASQKAPDAIRWYRNTLLLSAALVIALYGWYEKIMVWVQDQNPTWQIFSTFFNPNVLGGFLAIVFFLALSTALATRELTRRLLWAFCALVLAVTIYPTYSKGATLAFAVAAAAYLVLLGWHHERTRRLARAVVIAGAVCLLVSVLALLASGSLRQQAGAAVSIDSASNMFRILTWQGSIRVFAAHPWVGVGPGAFKYAFPRYALAGYTEASHQNYLQMFAELGVAGGLLFLWLLGAVLFTAGRAMASPDYRGRLLAIGGVCAIVAFMVHSLFDYDWYIGAINVTFWAVAGMLVHLTHCAEVANPPPSKRAAFPPGRNAKYGVAAAALCLAAYLGVFVPERNALAQRALERGDAYAMSAQGGERSVYSALAEYDRAKQYDPGWADAWERYGLVAGTVGDLARGLEALEKAQQLTPMSFKPYVSMGELYSHLGRYDEAVEAYRKGLELYAHHTKTMRKLAIAYEQLGDIEQALAMYGRLAAAEDSLYNRYRALEDIEVDTNFAYAHYALGVAAVVRAGGDPERLTEALEHYRSALRIIDEYFAKAERTDTMFLALRRPREYRPPDMRALQAKLYWRVGDVFAELDRETEAIGHRKKGVATWEAAGGMATGGLPDLAELLAQEEAQLK
jgi:O-antigen ligase/tetratricopeptide (TPR) repeat protein